jgi:tetratricopeptide (TPR) repeat protein
MERGDTARGEALLADAVRACPADAEARRRYGEALWRRGAQAEAMAQVEEARTLADEDVELAVLAGTWYLAVGRPDAALQAADAALALDGSHAGAWALHGRLMRQRGDLRQALADFQRSLSLAPDASEVLFQLAGVYRELGQPERALIVLHALADSYPPGDRPLQLVFAEGTALAALGRHRDAADRFADCLARGQPSPDLLCHLAECQLRLGKPAAARASAVHALALDPLHPAGRQLIDRLRLAAADVPAARR